MKNILSVLAVGLITSSCASITQGKTENINLITTYMGKTVSARCNLKNEEGSWETMSNSIVTVRKSNSDLEVVCKAPNMPDGILRAISRADKVPFIVGNLLAGGQLIGGSVDHYTGAGYKYAAELKVKMGELLVVDNKEDSKNSTQHESADTFFTNTLACRLISKSVLRLRGRISTPAS